MSACSVPGIQEKILQYRCEIIWFEELQNILGPFNDFISGLLDAENPPVITALPIILKYRENEMKSTVVEISSFLVKWFKDFVLLPSYIIVRGEGREMITTVSQAIVTHMENYGKWENFFYDEGANAL